MFREGNSEAIQRRIDRANMCANMCAKICATHLDRDVGQGYCLHVEMSTIL